MPRAIINGRAVDLPDVATSEEIAGAGSMRQGRRVIHRTREGNYPVGPGQSVDVKDGDRFIDAPQRVKGGC